MLTPASLPRLQAMIAAAGLDGWLLFDFHGNNPIAGGVLGLEGMVTRRIFAWIPRTGAPLAITHAIEQGPWRAWPAEWRRERYSSWRSLEAVVRSVVSGKKVAMEYSPGDAVPYVDRIPAGVLELVRACGADVVSSAELVTVFHASWSADQLASHRRAAEVIAKIAREAMSEAGRAAGAGAPITEKGLQRWIAQRLETAGLEIGHPPIVAATENAADPHYGPSDKRPREIRRGDLLLIDLWGRERNGGALGVYADQTWMGSIGAPGARAVQVWEAVRDARDAALALLRGRAGARAVVQGSEVDDAARGVITGRGFGEFFFHRTGHSIDPLELHGSGPNIDNLETREERRLLPGVGFSIEPGIYIAGEIGARSEVNVCMGDGEVVVTPAEIQRDLIVV